MVDDKIAETLDIAPLLPTKQELRAAKTNKEFDAAKENLTTVIDVGTTALSDLFDLARQSQDPRLYRVLTELISVMTTANKELVEIKFRDTETQLKQQQLDGNVAPQTINQNLFVGSTADAMKMLEGKKDD